VLQILPIPCLSDNYAYLISDSAGERLLVDPSEAAPAFEALKRAGGRLTAILATHHHPDHVDGIAELVDAHPGIKVYGHASDRGRIPRQTEYLEDGELVNWSASSLRALHVPGHTRGAVAYLVEDAVFTGDTLFIAGCGRLFEGTPEMMHRSLNLVLAAIDPATRVFCGHEYTVSNLLFARTVEPDNTQVVEQLGRAERLRAEGLPTVGGTIAEERACNPFLRCDQPALRTALGLDAQASEIETFTALRRAKDNFRPPARPA
jgi:hydroxyacylglutathione hydrolase